MCRNELMNSIDSHHDSHDVHVSKSTSSINQYPTSENAFSVATRNNLEPQRRGIRSDLRC